MVRLAGRPQLQAKPLMRPSLKNISKRTAERARSAAAGSPEPAGREQPAPDAAPTPDTAERGAMRKRVRRLSRLREVQLRELGALVVEMRRLGRDNPELLSRKARETLGIDNELRRLRTALGERETLEQVVAAGVAGTCERCATLMATDDRFCPRCGLAVEAKDRAVEQAPPAAESDPKAAAPPPPPPPKAAELAPETAAPPPPPPPPPRDEKASGDVPPAPPPPADGDGGPSADRTRDQLTATAPPQP